MSKQPDLIRLHPQPDFPQEDLTDDNLVVLTHHFKHNPETKAHTEDLKDAYERKLAKSLHD